MIPSADLKRIAVLNAYTIVTADAVIRAGTITFTPDAAQGNSGPQGFAEIQQGRFDTSAGEGRGIIGGPHLISIRGYDGQNISGTDIHGAPLFPEYQTTQNLPRDGGTVDFDVP